jgi:hypothetical protein
MAGIIDLGWKTADSPEYRQYLEQIRHQNEVSGGASPSGFLDLGGILNGISAAGTFDPRSIGFQGDMRQQIADPSGEGDVRYITNPEFEAFLNQQGIRPGYTSGSSGAYASDTYGLVDRNGNPIQGTQWRAPVDTGSDLRDWAMYSAMMYGGANALTGGAGGGAGAGSGAGGGATAMTTSEQIAMMAANGMTDAEIAASLAASGNTTGAGWLTGAGINGSAAAGTASGLQTMDPNLPNQLPEVYEGGLGSLGETNAVHGTMPSMGGGLTAEQALQYGGAAESAAEYSNEGNNYPTSESTQGSGGSPVNSSVANNPFMNWLKNNPKQAIQLMGMLGGAAAGGSSGGGGSGSGGIGSLGASQANITATPAQALQRQYVAPPANYRPGFDPEHKFFTGIGSVGTGTMLPQDNTTPENRV